MDTRFELYKKYIKDACTPEEANLVEGWLKEDPKAFPDEVRKNGLMQFANTANVLRNAHAFSLLPYLQQPTEVLRAQIEDFEKN